MMDERQARAVSDLVLNTVENFLETAPAMEDRDITFGDHMDGEQPTVSMMRMTIDGERFLIMCKRGG